MNTITEVRIIPLPKGKYQVVSYEDKAIVDRTDCDSFTEAIELLDLFHSQNYL